MNSKSFQNNPENIQNYTGAENANRINNKTEKKEESSKKLDDRKNNNENFPMPNSPSLSQASNSQHGKREII